MSRYLLALYLSFLFISCNEPKKECTFYFSDYKFSIPNKVKNIKIEIPLDYKPYVGFIKTFDTLGSKYTMYSIQLKDSPYWTGDDNISENHYDNNSVIGITFSKKYNKGEFESLINNLSDLYQTSFSEVKTIKLNKSSIKYQVAIYGTCKIVISKSSDILRVSFYHGISGHQLEEYIKYSL